MTPRRWLGLLYRIHRLRGSLTPEQALTDLRILQAAIDAGRWQEAEQRWQSLHDSLHGGLLTQLPADQSDAAHQAAHRLDTDLRTQKQTAAQNDVAALAQWIRKLTPPQ